MNNPRPEHIAASPLRWGSAGFLGGAGLIGALWAAVGRGPGQAQPPPQPAPAPAAATTQAPPALPPITIYAGPQSLAQAPAAPVQVLVDAAPTTPPPTTTPTTTPTSNPGTTPTTTPEATPPPTIQPAPPPAPQTTPTTVDALTVRINVNTATLAELDTLPGVGPVIAQRIIDYRTTQGPIRSLEQLRNVRGIGEVTSAKLAPYIRFE